MYMPICSYMHHMHPRLWRLEKASHPLARGLQMVVCSHVLLEIELRLTARTASALHS